MLVQRSPIKDTGLERVAMRFADVNTAQCGQVGINDAAGSLPRAVPLRLQLQSVSKTPVEHRSRCAGVQNEQERTLPVDRYRDQQQAAVIRRPPSSYRCTHALPLNEWTASWAVR
jgi:hypothetical protein